MTSSSNTKQVRLLDSYSASSEGLGKGALFTIRLPISSDYTQIQGDVSIKKALCGFRIYIYSFLRYMHSLHNLIVRHLRLPPPARSASG